MSEQILSSSRQPRSGRLMYLDVLRAWSTFAVFILHVTQYYAAEAPSSVGFLLYNGLHSVARTAVPGFVMISGALLLDENYRYSDQKLKKMVKKRAVFFVLWSAFYMLCFGVLKPMLTGGTVSLYEAVSMLVNGYDHLWFVPMLIGLYLILPLLRLWVKRENQKYVGYYLILSLIFTSVLPFLTEKLQDLFPFFACFEGLYENLSLQYTAGYTGYFILGWYLNNVRVKNPRIWYIAGLCAMLVTFTGTQVFTVIKGEPRNFYSTFAVNIVLHSMAHFLLFKNWLGDRQHDNSRFSRIIQLVCVNSMGIYAIHPLLIQCVFKILGTGNAVFMIPLVSVAVFGLSLACTQILRRIPIAKDYLV